MASFGTLTDNGDTSEVTIRRPFVRGSGTFGGGTLTWYYKGQHGAWVAIPNAAFTSADQKVLEFERPVTIKGTLAGATTPSLAWEIR